VGAVWGRCGGGVGAVWGRCGDGVGGGVGAVWGAVWGRAIVREIVRARWVCAVGVVRCVGMVRGCGIVFEWMRCGF
jgi:hypothetical protein